MPLIENKAPWRPWVRRHVVRMCETGSCCGQVASCFCETNPGLFMWLCSGCADELELMTDEECLAVSTAQNRRIK